MKLKNLLNIGLALSLLCVVPAYAESKHKTKYIESDPLVGAFTSVNADNTIFGSFVFNPGGTWTGQITADLGVPSPGADPCGTYTTVGLGTWKKIGCRTYKFFVTNVTVTRQSPGEAPQCCCPATPLWRQKGEAIVSLSQDCQFISSEDLLLSFWDVNDLSLESANIVPPFSTGPFFAQRVGK